MIEDFRAVQALDTILRVKGLDAILVGPYDLSASAGCTGDFTHSRFRAALVKILKDSKRFGIPAGVHVVSPSPRELKKRIQEGFRLIAYSIDAVLLAEALRSRAQK
jgi:2-dehydro-3-deoxyglucarate aldolase